MMDRSYNLTDEERALLTLSCLDGIGTIISRNLIGHLGSAHRVIASSRRELLEIDGIGPKLADLILSPEHRARADEEIAILERHQGDIAPIFWGSEAYPDSLAACVDAPLVLYLRGQLPVDVPMISIVGTRRMTGYTEDVLRQLLSDMARLAPEVVIVSGLAYGVDVTAHRLALEYGLKTIAVVAHGHHTLYPALHRQVASEMIEHGGGVLTEYPFYTKPLPQRFVSRNRIVAGLSLATIVIESPTRGGALITGNMAFDYGRSLYAVPGRLFDANSEGCNRLIASNKAAIVTDAETLLRDLNIIHDASPTPHNTPPIPFDDEIESSEITRILASADVLSVEDLALRLGKDIGYVASQLFDLELDGRVRSLPGGRYQLTHTVT